MFPLTDFDSPDLDRWYREQVLIHEGPLRSYLHRTFPIVTDPENLVQETFVRVLQAHRTTPVENVRAYVFTTARHLALALLRRRKIISIESIAEIEALDICMDESGVPERVGLKLELDILQEAIQALPERCRMVLTLRKIEGLSQREIALRLGISEHTVEAQVSNGMRRCAQFLRQRGVMPTREDRV